MFKKVIALLTCAVMMVAASGCSMMVLDTEKDNAQVVATVYGEDITKGEALAEFELALGGYELEGETREMYLEYVLDYMIDNVIYERKAEEMKLSLSEDELAEIDKGITELKKSIEDSVRASLEGEENFEEEVSKMLSEYLEMYGLNDDTYRDSAIAQKLQEKLYDKVVEDITVTEADAKAKYDELLASQKEALDADPGASVTDTVVYNAPGRRYVKNLLIAIDEDKKTEIDALKKEGDTEAAEKLYNEALAAIKEEADDVLSQVKKGRNFDLLIEKYGDDAGVKTNPDGYIVYKGCKTYVTEFTNAAMALESVGSYTDLVATDFGYHILLYASDAPTGDIPYEDVAEDIMSDLLENLQSERFETTMADWREEANITKKVNKLF